MKKSDYILKSFLNAIGTVVYIALIAWLLSNAKNIFGDEDPHSMFVPVMMLLLFIISATITSLLVLGRPIYLYLNNKRREAIILLLATLAWLVFFLFLVALTLIME